MRIPFEKLTATQKIPRVFWNSKVLDYVQSSPSLVPTFSQIIQTTHCHSDY